jgi:hypothetical protein
LRFRLRTILILVAIVALFMEGLARRERQRELLRRSQSYALLAQKYAKAESFHKWWASLGERLNANFGDARGYRTVLLEVSEVEKVAKEEELMRMKYERAAAAPWFPIEPDPRVSEIERIANERGSPRSMSPQPGLCSLIRIR